VIITEKNYAEAEARCQLFQDWFKSLGLHGQVPVPDASRREFRRQTELVKKLVCRWPDHDQFMSAVGQSNHWTVINQADRQKIGWEQAPGLLWFWGEARLDCPRLGQTWNQLAVTPGLRVISLEEYFALWQAYRVETNQLLDLRTRSWLRTRFGAGALSASEYDCCRVAVNGYAAESLSFPYDYRGGRVAEVVKNVA
jgi:hypothetical protein